MKLTEVEIWGKRISVDVDDTGRFRAEHAGMYFGAGTLDGLVDQLKAAIRKSRARIAVAFTATNGKHCIVTGKHATSGRYLVRVDGKPDQMSGLPYDAMRPLTPEELEEHKRLREAVAAANTQLRKFEASHSFGNLRNVVDDALRKASVGDVEKKAEVQS